MSSIISESSLQRLEGAKKYLLRGAIWLLVGSVVAGAILIMFGGDDSGNAIAKFLATLLVTALMILVCVNNFKMLATRKADVQVYALIGLVSNVVWAILWILVVWLADVNVPEHLARLAAIFTYLSMLGLIGSNVMNIYEGEKRQLIRPLKITAVVCATYEMLYCTTITITEYTGGSEFIGRLGLLAAFVGFVWICIVIAALVISKDEKKKLNSTSQQPAAGANNVAKPAEKKSDEELRAEIEEQVRREMIEKEVRARMEVETKEKSK